MRFNFTKNEQTGIEISMDMEDKFSHWQGKNAVFEFSLSASASNKVIGDPLSEQKVLLRKEFVVQSPQMEFHIPANQVQGWLYLGYNLEVSYVAELFVKGLFGMNRENYTVFADPKYFKIYSVTPSILPKVQTQKLSYWKTFLIMGPIGKFFTILAFGLVAALIFSFVSQPFLYNDFLIQFSKAAIGLIVFSGLALLITFGTAGNYMTLAFLPNLPKINKDSQLRLGQLIHTQAKVDMHGVGVEIVGHVVEKFKYVSHSSKGSTSIRKAKEPANYITFFEEKIDFLPKGASLEGAITKTIDFKKFYDDIVPNFDITPEFGVSMSVRVNILADEFPDKYLDIPLDKLEVVKMEDEFKDSLENKAEKLS